MTYHISKTLSKALALIDCQKLDFAAVEHQRGFPLSLVNNFYCIYNM